LVINRVVYVAGYCVSDAMACWFSSQLVTRESRLGASVPRIAQLVLLVEWHFLSRVLWSLSDPEPRLVVLLLLLGFPTFGAMQTWGSLVSIVISDAF
jgi:hypothetical protein